MKLALIRKSQRAILFYCGGLTIITPPLFRLTEAWFIYENFQVSTHRITSMPYIRVGHTCCLWVNRPTSIYSACYSNLPHNLFSGFCLILVISMNPKFENCGDKSKSENLPFFSVAVRSLPSLSVWGVTCTFVTRELNVFVKGNVVCMHDQAQRHQGAWIGGIYPRILNMCTERGEWHV
jgi:hypothetical protein